MCAALSDLDDIVKEQGNARGFRDLYIASVYVIDGTRRRFDAGLALYGFLDLHVRIHGVIRGAPDDDFRITHGYGVRVIIFVNEADLAFVYALAVDLHAEGLVQVLHDLKVVGLDHLAVFVCELHEDMR